MPRKPEGDRPLTLAERQARHAKRRAERERLWERALRAVAFDAKNIREAREFALRALKDA